MDKSGKDFAMRQLSLLIQDEQTSYERCNYSNFEPDSNLKSVFLFKNYMIGEAGLL